MFILAGKVLLSWFSFVFIYLINTTTLAQPKLLAFACVEAANFTRNTVYERNLAANLAALPITNSGFGFYNVSIGQGSDRVNSIALCRGDLEPAACRSCLNDTIVKLRQVCPNQKEAIGYYNDCMLKYSNETILGNNQVTYFTYLANPQMASDKDEFNSLLRPLMEQLRLEAAAGGPPLLKFATGNTTGPDFATIYGLHQCTPDLSQMECNYCLENAGNEFVKYGGSGKVGGRGLISMCNFRYEIYQFYNQTALVIPPPSRLLV